MTGVNTVLLLGRLGQDPQLNRSDSGAEVTTFGLATSEVWTDKSGEKKERTTWHKIVVWGKLAVICATHLQKGRAVFIEGKIRVREYTDQDGAKRQSFEIHASQVQFIDGPKRESAPEDSERFFGT
jgi:single-strand DNA-binding protein